jgi:hypothetical protein
MIEPSGRSNRWRTVVVVLGCALVAAGAIAVAAEGRKPDATIEFEEGSVAAGTGYSWEKGWLVYRGDRHPFRISGLTAGEVGGEKVRVRGEVYNLRSVPNFNGNYTSTGAGATRGGDFDVEVMRNRNDVEVKFVSTTKGADLRAAIQGVTITLETND